MQQSKIFVKYHPLFSLVSKILPLFVLLFGGILYLNQKDGSFTLGDLGAFIQYSTNIVWPMEMLGWLTNSLSSAVASNKKYGSSMRKRPPLKIRKIRLFCPG